MGEVHTLLALTLLLMQLFCSLELQQLTCYPKVTSYLKKTHFGKLVQDPVKVKQSTCLAEQVGSKVVELWRL